MSIERDGTRPDDERRRRFPTVVAAVVAVLVGVAVPLIVIVVSRDSSASFADAEILADNRLGAAVVDLQVDAGPTEGPSPEAIADETGERADTAVFQAENLAPGDHVTGYLQLSNGGDLPLWFGLQAATDGGLLGDWLRFDVWVATAGCRPDGPGARLVQDVQLGRSPVRIIGPDSASGNDGLVLRPGQSIELCLGARLPLETPNEAQGQRIDVTLLLPAEQLIEEDDS